MLAIYGYRKLRDSKISILQIQIAYLLEPIFLVYKF
jgi:hypothetical protein